MVRPSAVIAISWVEPGMSIVAVMASVAASRKCTLWAVFAVTIRLGPPGRLLRSNIVALATARASLGVVTAGLDPIGANTRPRGRVNDLSPWRRPSRSLWRSLTGRSFRMRSEVYRSDLLG